MDIMRTIISTIRQSKEYRSLVREKKNGMSVDALTFNAISVIDSEYIAEALGKDSELVQAIIMSKELGTSQNVQEVLERSNLKIPPELERGINDYYAIENGDNNGVSDEALIANYGEKIAFIVTVLEKKLLKEGIYDMPLINVLVEQSLKEGNISIGNKTKELIDFYETNAGKINLSREGYENQK